jgi:hypothetical protein
MPTEESTDAQWVRSSAKKAEISQWVKSDRSIGAWMYEDVSNVTSPSRLGNAQAEEQNRAYSMPISMHASAQTNWLSQHGCTLQYMNNKGMWTTEKMWRLVVGLCHWLRRDSTPVWCVMLQVTTYGTDRQAILSCMPGQGPPLCC